MVGTGLMVLESELYETLYNWTSHVNFVKMNRKFIG